MPTNWSSKTSRASDRVDNVIKVARQVVAVIWRRGCVVRCSVCAVRVCHRAILSVLPKWEVRAKEP